MVSWCCTSCSHNLAPLGLNNFQLLVLQPCTSWSRDLTYLSLALASLGLMTLHLLVSRHCKCLFHTSWSRYLAPIGLTKQPCTYWSYYIKRFGLTTLHNLAPLGIHTLHHYSTTNHNLHVLFTNLDVYSPIVLVWLLFMCDFWINNLLSGVGCHNFYYSDMTVQGTRCVSVYYQETSYFINVARLREMLW